MAKQVESKKKIKQEKPIIPEKYQDYVYVGMLVLGIIIFFSSAIFGDGFLSSDNIASRSFETYINEANDSGNFPLWVPYIFSGMPSYGSLLTTGERFWDIIPQVVFGIADFVGQIFENDSARIIFYYIIYSIGMYFLMRMKDQQRFVAFFTAMAAVFSTSVIIWVMIGHNTKPVVFAMIPYVFMFMERIRKKFSILYSVLLVFSIHIMLEAGHVQMIFYSGIAFGLYLIFELISRLISKKDPMSIVKVAGVLILAGGLAFLMSSDRYLSILEYTEHSTRGSAPVVQSETNKQDESGGNDYNYATDWSFSPEEITTFFVPNYFGFGKLKYEGPLTRGEETTLMTYWGQKPFEDAAPYMGIFVLVLAVVGAIYYRRNVFVQFLIALSVFALFLSFGKNLSLLYDFFFYNVPSFNKFRAPSMVLALVHFAVPVLAGYGLSAVFKWRTMRFEEFKKPVYVLLISSAAFLILGFLFSAGFQTSYMEALQTSNTYAMYQQNGQQVADMVSEFVWDSMISDWYFTAFLLLASAVMIFFYAKRTINSWVFYIGIIALLLIDLWRVGYRPMEIADGTSDKDIFPVTDIVQTIKQDNSVYRIADFVSQSPNMAAFHLLENINGYHSAKLRLYQDLMDVAQEQKSTSMVQNPFLWNLLNAKYIIYPQQINHPSMQLVLQSKQTGAFLYVNRTAMQRVQFVETVEVADKMQILEHLKKGDFYPYQVAYVEEKLPIAIDTLQKDVKAFVKSRSNESMTIEAIATGNNLLFISEIYYPGWKAYLDGEEIPIYKTNYAFRSVIVPQGKHTIELKFESEGFERGKSLSIITNVVVILALIGGIILERKRKPKIVEKTEK